MNLNGLEMSAVTPVKPGGVNGLKDLRFYKFEFYFKIMQFGMYV